MTKEKEKFTERQAINRLNKKHDCRVDYKRLKIEVLSNRVFDGKTWEFKPNKNKVNDLGSGSWATIDFLVKQCGYSVVRVPKFKHNNHFKRKAA